jgi:hypothetical protein
LFTRTQIFKRRLSRVPVSIILGGLVTYFFNLFVLRPIYLNDITEMGLADKYFFLDLNADMMREDLDKMGIKIKAQHFNLKETEKRLLEQQSILAEKDVTK